MLLRNIFVDVFGRDDQGRPPQCQPGGTTAAFEVVVAERGTLRQIPVAAAPCGTMLQNNRGYIHVRY
jgi:hypothetical protein